MPIAHAKMVTDKVVVASQPPEWCVTAMSTTHAKMILQKKLWGQCYGVHFWWEQNGVSGKYE